MKLMKRVMIHKCIVISLFHENLTWAHLVFLDHLTLMHFLELSSIEFKEQGIA